MYSGPHKESLNKRFEWHPVYRGRTTYEVFQELHDQIVRDQNLFMDSRLGTSDMTVAEAVDAKWRDFGQTWFDMKPGDLAAEVVSFEIVRETTKKMYSPAEWRREENKMDRWAARTGRPLNSMRNIDVILDEARKWIAVVAIIALVIFLLVKAL